MERQGGKIRVAVVPARGPRHARATGCPVAGTHDQRACELRSWWSWISARGRCAALTGMTSFGISLLLVAGAAAKAECAADALGTSRVLAVDPAAFPRVGRKQFPATLPLGPREVVLTFDDGPWPGTTAKILDALRAECVRATFFVLGRNALAHPDILRREFAEGHTVAHHTWSHPLLNRIASSPALLDRLARRRIVVFGADLWASDWNPMSPEAELRLVLHRLEQARGGIVLFHDTKRQTAAMLPALLRALKARGFRVVHVVPRQATER